MDGTRSLALTTSSERGGIVPGSTATPAARVKPASTLMWTQGAVSPNSVKYRRLDPLALNTVRNAMPGFPTPGCTAWSMIDEGSSALAVVGKNKPGGFELLLLLP